jgi:hypothetical protein
MPRLLTRGEGGESPGEHSIGGLELWQSTWDTCTPGACENILRNHFNLEPALILALTKIRPRIEMLACQKQAQSSH